VVLETPPEGAPVWVGCREDVDPAVLRSMVDAQDKAGLVALLNRIVVYPGDAVLVPSGAPHCTGAGAFVLELQEPTDFSVLLEWDGFALDGPTEGRLGLGFDVALQCVNRRAFTSDQLDAVVRRNGAPRVAPEPVALMPALADSYFRAMGLHTTSSVTVAASFAIVALPPARRCRGSSTRPRNQYAKGDGNRNLPH
jgi:mannose-6-phosphate isomerase